MALESGSPINGASMSSLESNDGNGYNDLLNTDVRTDALDLTRHRIAEGSDFFDSGPPEATAEKIKLEDSEPVIAWDAMDNVVDLTQIKEENDEETYDWNDMDESMIELSDSEESEVKEEPEEEPFQWKSMSRGTIDIDSNTDDERDLRMLNQVMVDDVPIKTEAEEVEFLWQNTDKRVVDILDSDEERILSKKPKLGQSLLDKPGAKRQRPKIDIAEIKRRQQMYAEKARSQHGRVPKGQDSSTDSTDESDDSGQDFEELKRAYKAKKKTHTNELEDDILFKKAQKKENERIRKRKQEMVYGDGSSEAQESDGGLFIRPGHSTNSSSAKHSFLPADDDEENGLSQASQGKPAPKKGKAKKMRNEADAPTKQSRAKDKKAELCSNYMAGIEAILLRDQLKQYETEEAQIGSRDSKRKRSSTKFGQLSNVGSLMTSNVYADSNANLDESLLPVMAEKNKREFLASLIAGIHHVNDKQAKSDTKALDKAGATLWPHMVRPDGNGGWSVPHMKSTLYHYQVQGAAHMKKRETGDEAPYGGILADEMGLGKTVITIATMVANQPKDPKGPKCTLIVCSLALILQWESEIKAHVKDGTFPIIHRHHGGTKYSDKNGPKEMEIADIVLTTWTEVLKSYPRCQVPEEHTLLADKEAWWKKEWEENRGLLHRAHFYRITRLSRMNLTPVLHTVLDEAQAIKNHTSQTSIACRALMTKHRWAISGTPIQNRLEELYPYFKFLRMAFTGSMAVFRRNFCRKGSEVCHKRLISVIDGIMIRRVHTDKFMGRPLVQLPENHQETVTLKFNKVERHLYDVYRTRCINAINSACQEGTLEGHKYVVIVMLQRLRQMVAHIFAVQETLEKEFNLRMIKALWKDLNISTRCGEDLEASMLMALEKMMLHKRDDPDNARIEALFTNAAKQSNAPKRPKQSSTLAEGFGRSLRDLKKNSKFKVHKQLASCQSCGKPPRNPLVTSCFHVYCKSCLESLAYAASDRWEDQTVCPKCGEVYIEAASCKRIKKDLEIVDLSATVFQGKKDVKETMPKFNLTMDFVDSNAGLILSTKTIAVKKQLQDWMNDDSGRKIIVFTEWLMIGHLLGRVCQQEGWESCHYNGRMSNKARERSLTAIQEDPEMKIMIASLKCGGTGLNLTAACRVISVDLWFNDYVEQQGELEIQDTSASTNANKTAFCRVHRIGQVNETYITRFRVEDTVDDRLLAMQKEKKEIIGAALDNRAVLSKLDLTDLMGLFGDVSLDENSKPFIVVDDHASMRNKKDSA